LFELARFTLSDMVRCSAGVRHAAEGAQTMEGAATGIVAYLYETLVDKRSGDPGCALVRLYKAHPFEELPPELQAVALAAADGHRAWEGVSCLTLLATAGDEPGWNARRHSVKHQAIPLHSALALEQLPMVKAVVDQFGLEAHEVVAPHPSMFEELDERSYDVFHVADALGSPLIPAQEQFVLRYGIKSVLGFGGVMPTGSVFAVILFSKTKIPHETAEMFGSIALSVKLALLPFVHRRVFASDPVVANQPEHDDERTLRSRVAALEQLVEVREETVLNQALRLESAVEEAERRAEDATRAEQARAESEARKGAVVDAAPDGIITIDESGTILEFNPAAETIFGYMRGEALGRPMAELIVPPSLRGRHYRGLEDFLRTGTARVLGKRVQLVGMRRDESEFPVELTVTSVQTPGARFFTGHLRDITDRLASEAAIAAGEARAAHIARTLQSSLLPPLLPLIPGLEMASRYHPAGDGSEVGGDFYDVFQTAKDDWGVVLGDVCGKGAEAAAVIALARYTIRAAATRLRRPSSILRVLNEAVYQQHPERFCTVVYCRMRLRDQRWRLTIAAGGHPPCLIVRPTAELIEVGGRGPLVGPFEHSSFAETNYDLQPGESALLYTDGVTEAGRGRHLFGEERLREVLRSAAGSTAGSVAGAVESAVLDFGGAEPRDDIALLVVHRPACLV